MIEYGNLNFLNPNHGKTTNEIEKEIGSLLKKYRIYKNIKQVDLARKAGISRSQLIQIEKTGKTTLGTIIEIARALNCVDKVYQLFEVPKIRPTDFIRDRNLKNDKLRVRN